MLNSELLLYEFVCVHACVRTCVHASVHEHTFALQPEWVHMHMFHFQYVPSKAVYVRIAEY